MTVDSCCLFKREYGILLHVTSLPSGPSGGLGPDAYRFVDFLAAAGGRVWQVLPLVPTHEDSSPYLGLSVHAGNPLMISPQILIKEGLIDDDALIRRAERAKDHAEIGRAQHEILSHAYRRFVQRGDESRQQLAAFEHRHGDWIIDYALYRVLKREHGDKPWFHWPPPLRSRRDDALVAARRSFDEEIQIQIFEQYLFRAHWKRLKDYANEHGIRIMGDMPIFVAHDSADVWASPRYFQLDASGQPLFVAGVPPDYFSDSGQLWGNPVYDWRQLSEDGFSWWIERFRSQLEIFDLLRIDHFRGYRSYWSIAADSEDATTGRWEEVPGSELFDALYDTFSRLPLIAEDLGYITTEVEEFRQELGLPGMRVLQFAFDGDPRNPHLPHNHESNSVVYTGTHDNSTTLGWYAALDAGEQARVYEYLGNTRDSMPRAMIRAAMASVAQLAVLPLQDVMALGDEHRMNTPGTSKGNWQWRFAWSELPFGTADWLRHLALVYGR